MGESLLILAFLVLALAGAAQVFLMLAIFGLVERGLRRLDSLTDATRTGLKRLEEAGAVEAEPCEPDEDDADWWKGKEGDGD